MNQIYADIMRTEKEERSMLQWLSTLFVHTFQVTMDDVPSESKSLNKGADVLDNSNMKPVDKSGDEEENSSERSEPADESK